MGSGEDTRRYTSRRSRALQMSYREIRKRVPINLTVSQWRDLLAEFPGEALAQVLLQIHIRGLAEIRADRARSEG